MGWPRRRARTRDPGETRTVRRLRVELAESRQIHALAEDPLLVVVRLERQRQAINRSMWFFLVCGLGFTTTGVHAFLAGHLTPADPVWWGAWLVEPALAGILVTVLRWEADMFARGLSVQSRPVTRLKRLLLIATLVTNVWSALDPADGTVTAGMVFLHLVIPLVVYLLAEVMPVIQQRCIQAKEQASRQAPPPADPAPATAVESVPVSAAAPAPASAEPAPAAPADPAPAPRPEAAPEPPADSPPPASVSPPVRPALTTRLPAPMRELIQQAAQQAAIEGRALTSADVRAVVRVPEALAEQIAQEMQVRNRHALV